MLISVRILLASLMIAALNLGEAAAASSTLEKVKTPRGASQAFILIKPDNPVVAVILFAGGHGALGLQSATTMRWGRRTSSSDHVISL